MSSNLLQRQKIIDENLPILIKLLTGFQVRH